MKRSMKYGLVLLTMLMALSIGVAFGENVTTARQSLFMMGKYEDALMASNRAIEIKPK
jgi:hypothetical protein